MQQVTDLDEARAKEATRREDSEEEVGNLREKLAEAKQELQKEKLADKTNNQDILNMQIEMMEVGRMARTENDDLKARALDTERLLDLAQQRISHLEELLAAGEADSRQSHADAIAMEGALAAVAERFEALQTEASG